MALGWKDTTVLWREPVLSTLARIAKMAIAPVGLLMVSGVPGTDLVGIAPWAALRVVAFVIALPTLALFIIAIANVFRNKRVLVALRPSGAIERPRTLQEIWLKHSKEYVSAGMGDTLTVHPVEANMHRQSVHPLVHLSAHDRSIVRLPLHGMEVEDFAEQLKEALGPRGIKVVVGDEQPVKGVKA